MSKHTLVLRSVGAAILVVTTAWYTREMQSDYLSTDLSRYVIIGLCAISVSMLAAGSIHRVIRALIYTLCVIVLFELIYEGMVAARGCQEEQCGLAVRFIIYQAYFGIPILFCSFVLALIPLGRMPKASE